MNFFDTVKDKKIRWSSWKPGTWFTPHVQEGELLVGTWHSTNEDITITDVRYMIGTGFTTNVYDECWEWHEEVVEVKHTIDSFSKFRRQVCEEINTLVDSKNKDYTAGVSPFANFEKGEEWGVDRLTSLFIRMEDKVQRLKSFCKHGTLAVKGEGVDDALKDIIGYCLIGLAMLDEGNKE